MFLFVWHPFTVICIPTLLRHLAEYFPQWQIWRLCKWNLFHFQNGTLVGFGVEATSSLGLLVSYPSSSSCLTCVTDASFPFPRRGLRLSKRARGQARLGWDHLSLRSLHVVLEMNACYTVYLMLGRFDFVQYLSLTQPRIANGVLQTAKELWQSAIFTCSLYHDPCLISHMYWFSIFHS